VLFIFLAQARRVKPHRDLNITCQSPSSPRAKCDITVTFRRLKLSCPIYSHLMQACAVSSIRQNLEIVNTKPQKPAPIHSPCKICCETSLSPTLKKHLLCAGRLERTGRCCPGVPISGKVMQRLGSDGMRYGNSGVLLGIWRSDQRNDRAFEHMQPDFGCSHPCKPSPLSKAFQTS
jgi:hypothetical protein